MVADFSVEELYKIRQECLRLAVHQATDMYPAFTDDWRRKIHEISEREFKIMTGSEHSKCSKCGR